MSTSYYRIQSADRTATDLLDNANWTSYNYGTSGDEDARYGVSTCGSLEELAGYLAQSGVEFTTDSVIVELEGDLADDDDHDADKGAILIWPTAIVSVTPASDEFFDMINAAYDRIYS